LTCPKSTALLATINFSLSGAENIFNIWILGNIHLRQTREKAGWTALRFLCILEHTIPNLSMYMEMTHDFNQR
jgi:hypothetical protein